MESCDAALRALDLGSTTVLDGLLVVHRLLALRHRIGDFADVRELADQCMLGAERLGDEVLVHHLLTLQADHAARSDSPWRSALAARREALRGSTHYARCAGARGTGPLWDAALVRLGAAARRALEPGRLLS